MLLLTIIYPHQQLLLLTQFFTISSLLANFALMVFTGWMLVRQSHFYSEVTLFKDSALTVKQYLSHLKYL
jgi:hypothetical protein